MDVSWTGLCCFSSEQKSVPSLRTFRSQSSCEVTRTCSESWLFMIQVRRHQITRVWLQVMWPDSLCQSRSTLKWVFDSCVNVSVWEGFNSAWTKRGVRYWSVKWGGRWVGGVREEEEVLKTKETGQHQSLCHVWSLLFIKLWGEASWTRLVFKTEATELTNLWMNESF